MSGRRRHNRVPVLGGRKLSRKGEGARQKAPNSAHSYRGSGNGPARGSDMSGIRVTGGSHKGRRIASGRDGRARYTSAKARQAVFDIVGDIEGFIVLDLFAGAGSFTVEALSRGAASVVAVEKDGKTASLLAANLKNLALDKDCLVVNMDVRYAVPMLRKQGRHFDLIFADPPYEMGYVALLVELMKGNGFCSGHSIFVIEHSKREAPPCPTEGGCGVRTRKYGDTVLTVITCPGKEEPSR